MKKLFLILVLVLLPAIALAGSKDLTFAWDQVISEDFGGWELHYGTSPGVYTAVIDIKYIAGDDGEYSATQTIVAPDGAETTFYFAILAYDTVGNKSVFSNEVSTTLDFEAPLVPQTLRVTVETL
ncbi:unnamed protein product [marine sediment metagenome]|uniref:Fibronectin type-III domain-containing protein n=1 Tax=marine sediment metagenome TaxID=412755 RepID=X0YHG7_9ZZZZ